MDEIAVQVERVVAAARAVDCVIVRGTVESSGTTVVQLDDDPAERACDEFIDALKATKPIILIVNREHLEEHDVKAAIETAEAAEGADNEQRKAVLHELAQCRKRIGETASAQMSFLAAPTVRVELTLYASWNQTVYATEEELGDEGEDRYSDTLSESKLNEMGRTLAEHARFQRATTRPARLSAARDLLEGDECIRNDQLEEIVAAAQSIHDHEIKPAREQELRERVHSMLGAGKTKAQIAGELKMTLGNVKKLLA